MNQLSSPVKLAAGIIMLLLSLVFLNESNSLIEVFKSIYNQVELDPFDLFIFTSSISSFNFSLLSILVVKSNLSAFLKKVLLFFLFAFLVLPFLWYALSSAYALSALFNVPLALAAIGMFVLCLSGAGIGFGSFLIGAGFRGRPSQ